MQDSTTARTSVRQFQQDFEARLRESVREAIETVLEEELLAALGADWHQRTAGRRGYRHGTGTRTVTTREGTRTLTVPRARSAVSRVVARLKEQFAAWQGRSLADARYAIVFLDGFHLRVRLAGRVVVVPVLAALGVTETGQKQLVALQLAAAEATASWSGLLADLQRRGLPAPLLVVTDGHAGLKKALEGWPTVRVQRCTTHKRRNLDDACPVHARPELRRDYHRIISASDGLAARAAHDACLKKWSTLCPPVARSLEEAGVDLLTFYSFPKTLWKCVRTTNALENLNREFRRRTKTQASFSSEAAGLTVLFGLVVVGQIAFRKIDGHQDLAAFLVKERWAQAA